MIQHSHVLLNNRNPFSGIYLLGVVPWNHQNMLKPSRLHTTAVRYVVWENLLLPGL